MDDLDIYQFSTKDGFNAVLLKLRYHHLAQYFKGDCCLEFGCADGEGTKLLLPYFKKLVAVDGSKKLIDQLKQEVQDTRLEVVHSFFEHFNHAEKFDTVVLAHILEHVDNPIEILAVASRFLKKDGIMIVDVPNAKSIHRQIGVEIGLIRSIYTLNEADVSIGHQRVYDMESFVRDIEAANLKVVEKGGLFMKFLSNAQLEKILDEKQIQAFNVLGIRYPELAGEIFVTCQLP